LTVISVKPIPHFFNVLYRRSGHPSGKPLKSGTDPGVTKRV